MTTQDNIVQVLTEEWMKITLQFQQFYILQKSALITSIVSASRNPAFCFFAFFSVEWVKIFFVVINIIPQMWSVEVNLY